MSFHWETIYIESRYYLDTRIKICIIVYIYLYIYICIVCVCVFLWILSFCIQSVGFSGTPKEMGPPYGKLPILFPNPTPSPESLKIWVPLVWELGCGFIKHFWEPNVWENNPNLTSIFFQMGWFNHQLGKLSYYWGFPCPCGSLESPFIQRGSRWKPNGGWTWVSAS